jgi:Tol biopolymer transport system component
MSKKVAIALGVTALAAPVGALSASGSRTFDHTYGARWSPAGSRVAFVVFGNGRSPALKLATAAGTRPVTLTSSWYVAQAPAWSPRGRKLAFVRMRNVSDPDEASSLWTVDIRTRAKKRLALSSARYDPNSDLAWSPSGSRIAFTLLDEPPNSVAAYRIYTVKATGGSRRLLTWGQRPDWSPGGKTIVFDSTPWPYSTTEVWAVNADGTGTRLLASQASQPRFSPDGGRIAFQRDGDIWSINADGSDQERLTDAPEPDVVPRWSPDGRRLAFLRGSSPYQLYVMNADGSGQAQVAPSPAFDPDWSPNGKSIAYARCGLSGFRSCRVAFANVGASIQAERRLG